MFSLSSLADCLDATNLRYYLIIQNIPVSLKRDLWNQSFLVLKVVQSFSKHAEQILAVNRVMEMVGIVLSIICISLSLFIFIYHE